jgi:hypothetical protein
MKGLSSIPRRRSTYLGVITVTLSLQIPQRVRRNGTITQSRTGQCEHAVLRARLKQSCAKDGRSTADCLTGFTVQRQARNGQLSGLMRHLGGSAEAAERQQRYLL